MIYVNWKWRMRNNDQGYMACAEVYHDAIKKDRTRCYAEKLADDLADKIIRSQRRYYIKLQWRQVDGPREIRFDKKRAWKNALWRQYRNIAVIPILFPTREAAEEYMDRVDIFKNLRHHRKLSASIEMSKIKENTA